MRRVFILREATMAKSHKRHSVYVAGPMRGIKDFNFPAFDETADYLRARSFNVFNPADRDRDIHGPDVNKSETGSLSDIVGTGFSLREALSADLSWVAEHADAICVLPGWQNSKGAIAEVALAHALGLPVAYAEAFVPGELPESLDVDIEPSEEDAAIPFTLTDSAIEELAETFAMARADIAHAFQLDEEPTSTNGNSTFVINNTYSARERAERKVAGFRELDDRREISLVRDDPPGEVRTVSSTGGEKGVKTERFDLIPADSLRKLAYLYGKGSEKYADRNWEAGYEWSKSYGAMQRHAWQFWNGEDLDEETGVPHVINVAWHAFALAHFILHPDNYRVFDDRPDSDV